MSHQDYILYIHACEWHFTYYLHLSKAAYCADCTLPSYRLTSSCLIEANLAGQGGRHLKGAQDPVVIRKMATWYLKIWIWPLEMVVKLIIGEMVKIHQNNSMYIYLSLLFSCIFSCKSYQLGPPKSRTIRTHISISWVSVSIHRTWPRRQHSGCMVASRPQSLWSIWNPTSKNNGNVINGYCNIKTNTKCI